MDSGYRDSVAAALRNLASWRGQLSDALTPWRADRPCRDWDHQLVTPHGRVLLLVGLGTSPVQCLGEEPPFGRTV